MRRKTSTRVISLLLAMIIIAAGSMPGFPAAAVYAESSEFEATGTIYYVDSEDGDDANEGTSPAEAWQTLDQISATTFEPGDAILFKAGGVWSGGVHPKGSGIEGHPIQIDKYGEGPKPVLNGGGVAATIYFHNQEYWEVRNLEITNYALEPGQRRGIHVAGQSGAWNDPYVFRHFVFEDLEIHSVKGQLGSSYAQNGGIVVWDPSWSYVVSDVVINNNKIYSLDSVGIYLNGGSLGHAANNVITNNTIYDIAADGAILLNAKEGGLIENNVVYDTHKRSSGYHVPLWTFETRDAIIQNNEVFNTHPGGDAMAYDSDYKSRGTIIQYNYSHNNAGGAYLVTSDGGSTSNYNEGSIVRYNISQNDLGAVFTISGNPTDTHFYNNTIYIGDSLNTRMTDFLNWNAWPTETYFYNNILVNYGSGGYVLGGNPESIEFDNNLFWGNHAAAALDKDENKIVADPLLAAPGTARIGKDTVVGYQLLEGSPAIGAGKMVADNGGRDYWGNPVPADSPPNIGAYEGPGLDPDNLPELPELVNLLANPGFEDGDFTGYTNFYNGAAVVEEHARTGQHAAVLSAAPSGIEQEITGLEPNTLYVLSAYAKRADGQGGAVLGVRDYGGALQDVNFNSGSDYVKRQVTFITGNENTSAVIYLYKPNAAGTIYFDDLELYKYGEVGRAAVPPPLPPGALPGKQNLAPLATVTASSHRVNESGAFSPDKAVDGIKDNNPSRWLNDFGTSAPHWLQLDWEEEYEINVVRVWSGIIHVSGNQIPNFDIQYWDSDEEEWKVAAAVRNNNRDGNNGQYNNLVFHPVTTSSMRLYIGTDDDDTIRLFEIEVWEYNEESNNPDPVSVESISITGAGGATSIHSLGETLQMTAMITPTDAVNQAIVWSVLGLDGEPTDVATISQSGLVTANEIGIFKVIAAASDGSGVTGELLMTIAIPDETHTNIAPLAAASASSVRADGTYPPAYAINGIKNNNNTGRWLSASDDAPPHEFYLEWDSDYIIDRVQIWSGFVAGGSAIAAYDIQYWDGDVWSTVASVQGNSALTRNSVFPAVTTNRLRMYITQPSVNPADQIARLIEFEAWGKAAEPGEPVPVGSIAVASENGEAVVYGVGASLQMVAEVSPDNAADKSVVWSVKDEDGDDTGLATISESGLLTALGLGTVKVIATANDGSAVSGETIVAIVEAEPTPETINLSPLAQVSASSVRPVEGQFWFPPENAVNGIKNNNNTGRWLSADGDLPPHTFNLEWDREYVINNVKIWSGHVHGGSTIYNYEIQYWDGSGWLTAASVTENRDTMNDLEFPAVTTDQVRMYITQTSVNPADTVARLIEIEVWGKELGDDDPVVVPVMGITVSPEILTLTAGGATAALTATVTPLDATNPDVAWSSSDEAVATVDSNGVVTPVAPGTAVITATTEDGEYSAGSAVTIQAPQALELSASLTGTTHVYANQPFSIEASIQGMHVEHAFDALQAIIHYDPAQLEFAAVYLEDNTVSLDDSAIASAHAQLHIIGTGIKQELGQIFILMAAAGGTVTADAGLFQLNGTVKTEAVPGEAVVSLSDFIIADGQSSAVNTTDAVIAITIEQADRNELGAAIDAAQTLHDAASEGSAPGQYPAGAKATLQAAIDAAEETYGNASAAQLEINEALTSLAAAVNAFIHSVNPEIPVNKDELDAALEAATALYANAVQGTKVGQYPAAAKSALHIAIQAALDVSEDTNASQTAINQAVSALNVAAASFKTELITLVPGETRITIHTLSLMAKFFGAKEGDTGWSEIEAADIFGDGEITIRELAAVARMIISDWFDN